MEEKKERNRQIAEEYRNRYKTGKKPVSMQELAKKYGISYARVQYLTKKGETNGK